MAEGLKAIVGSKAVGYFHNCVGVSESFVFFLVPAQLIIFIVDKLKSIRMGEEFSQDITSYIW